MNNVLSVNNKHTYQKNQKRSNHCWNLQLNKQNRKRKASLIKPFECIINELKTCRQWSKCILALNQHKNHEPIISRKLEIRNNQPQDFSRGTANRARASQDQHAATYDLAPKNYEEQDMPRITPSEHHARCRTVIWKKKIGSIKRDHLSFYVPEVLVVLRERRRGSSWTWRLHWTSALITAETKMLETHAVIAPVELVPHKGRTADKEDANEDWKAIKGGRTHWNEG